MPKQVIKSSADKIVEMVLRDGYELYVDEKGDPLIVRPDSPMVARSIKSKQIRGYVSKLHWEVLHKSIQAHTVDSVITTLEGIASSSGERKEVFNRVAYLDGIIYYDVGDDKHVIEITKDGWAVKTSCSVLFRRYQHQIAQELPIEGGDLKNICNYLNVSTEAHKILLTTYLPVALFPDIARQLLLMHGPQGSGKSTALSLIRSLIDPSVIPLLTPPTNNLDISRDANHNYCFYLDNVSGIDQKLSDAMCRLVTGSSLTKRELYSDDEDVIYRLKRAVGLNGVAQFANNPDLLDRCLIVQLERISEHDRRLDNELQEQFNLEKPKLLGALYSAIAGILASLDEVKSFGLTLPRMADYYLHAATASQVIGFGVEGFVDAYNRNVDEQNQESINASTVGILLLDFMTIHGDCWQGSASTLYSALSELADGNSTLSKYPRSPAWIWRKIQEIKPTLESIGILADKDDSVRPRRIILTKTEKFKPVPSDQLPHSPLDYTQPANTTSTKATEYSTPHVSKEEYLKRKEARYSCN